MAQPSPPVVMLRQPIPGQRGNNGSRQPRLGLSIPNPPSPNVAPINAPPIPQFEAAFPSRPHPPLRIKTPHGGAPSHRSRPILTLQPQPGLGSTHSVDSQLSDTSRSGSLIENGYISSSAASSVSLTLPSQDPLSATSGGTGSPSATSMERKNSLSLRELEAHLDQIKAGLDGHEPDVMDLDVEGWRAVSRTGKIIELGSLGEGAGGAVTRCIVKGGKTVFALKVITTNPDPDVKRQILRELAYNKSCESPYICKYFGAFDDSTGTISIAMEFCEGGSLDSVYKECERLGGRAGEKVIGKVAEGVLRGLHYLNSLHIMHRDIKPSNILICRDGQVKLCDFGVSGEFGTKGDANTFIGTSAYMAPERITGQRYKINSDVWSLGVTILEAAKHRFPFPADADEREIQPKAALIDLLSYIVRQPPPVLRDGPEPTLKWSDEMKSFIAKCLIKDPDERPGPLEMLEEPWMKYIVKKNVNMQQFLKKVWDWKD